MNVNYLRIVMPLAVLFLFYWNIYVTHEPAQSGNAANTKELTAEQARELLDLSRTQLREGKYEDALASTKRLYDAYPTNHAYLEQLATIYHNLERYKEEAEMWEDYVKVAPIPGEACPHLGEAYRKLGLMEKMIDACQRCLEFTQQESDSYFFLARAYEITNQLDKAKEYYERGIEVSPLYTDLSIGLARIHLRQGRVSNASKIVSKIIEQNPNNIDALLTYGMALRAEGRYEQAIQHLERGIQLSPKYTDFYIVLAAIAEQQGRIEQAIGYYNRALEINPEDRDFAEKRDRLTGGQP